MTETHNAETPADECRTVQVLTRLTSSDVHRAAKALPSKVQQRVARAVGVPITVLTSSGKAAELIRRRARRLDTGKAAALGRDLADACVAETIAALGDRHDRPAYEDLLGVLDPICDRWGTRLAALMLAATSDGDFNAAAVCARMLDEDPRFALDALGPVQEDAPPPSIGAPARTVNEAELETKREQRRRRRESKKAKQKAVRAEPPSYRKKRAAEPGEVTIKKAPPIPPGLSLPRSPTPMRRATVIGSYEGLDHDDELIGAVVHVYIPFRAPTPDGDDGKMRPCVVIAGCAPDSLIVRPCYSEGGARADDWRSVRITDPRSAGLDKNSYVAADEFVIERAHAEPVRGRLSRDDWNAL